MPIVKLFNGKKFSGDIIDDRDSVVLIENYSGPKKVIPKSEIFSIDF
jgi:hypothetical protein